MDIYPRLLTEWIKLGIEGAVGVDNFAVLYSTILEPPITALLSPLAVDWYEWTNDVEPDAVEK